MMDEQFTAKMYIDYTLERKELTLEDFDVAPIVILNWHHPITLAFARRYHLKRSEHWLYGSHFPLFTGEVHGKKVSFAHVLAGAPATVFMMEEIIACGAKLFIGMGYAGGLQDTTPAGTFVIPTDCIREEGTSFHYIKENVRIRPNSKLLKILQSSFEEEGIEYRVGPHWTTDAPYRELKEKVETYRGQGVLSVDMETSAMYAMCKFRGLPVCNFHIISDELWPKWKPSFGSPELELSLKRAESVIHRCLKEDLLGCVNGEDI